MAETTYLLFVWKPTGYELREERGELPEIGSVLDAENGRLRVTKIAPSPLPNDARMCAYVQAA